MDSGGFFFLIRHTTNEVISGEKVLITFLSNLNRLLLSLRWLSTRTNMAVILPSVTLE